MLAEKYPACFVVNPRNRRPLKKDIIDDLRVRERSWNEQAVEDVLSFYTNHWGYLYAMIAGASRVDLDGNEVEKVTEQEADEAEKTRIKSQQEHYSKQQRFAMPRSEDTFAKVAVSSRPEDAAQMVVTMMQRAKKGFGLALSEDAAKLRTSFFQPEMAVLYGPLGEELEKCLLEMERLGSKLHPEGAPE